MATNKMCLKCKQDCRQPKGIRIVKCPRTIELQLTKASILKEQGYCVPRTKKKGTK